MTAYDLALLSERLRQRTASAPDEGATAAVAILLRAPTEGREAEVLLIERAVRAGDPWSGHMAFPGGRRDPRDADARATAMRETVEEVGIDLAAHATFLTRLDDVPVIVRAHGENFRVAPFVFALDRDVSPTLNHEVAATLWTPVGPLARGERSGVYPFRWEGKDHALPCYRLDARAVWGLTYVMFQGLFEAVRG
jgi:8-oxo-dGTP pyrophosphatase MutT (NUDIX family)